MLVGQHTAAPFQTIFYYNKQVENIVELLVMGIYTMVVIPCVNMHNMKCNTVTAEDSLRCRVHQIAKYAVMSSYYFV